MRSPLAVAASSAALLLAGMTTPAAFASPAPASGSTLVTATSTANPVIGLQGRGYGHGRGMSQWGARGAASKGLTVQQILEFYYPGTTSSSIGNPLVRVRLTAMGNTAPTVVHESGLTLTDGTCTAPLDQAGATAWRVVRASGSWKLQGNYPVSGTLAWRDHATACTGFGTAANLTFVGDGSLAASVLTLRTPSGDRQYRGGLRAALDSRNNGAVVSVNALAMDSYLRSVVPAEMPASWGLEAVKAQAVAARSYTAARMTTANAYDICDTTACQVYPGLTSSNPEHPNSDAAVAGTTGLVRKYGSTIAHTEFSATNGGQTVASSLPYQVAKADPYDGVYAAAPDTWSYLTMPASAIESRWPAIGTFRSMRITRDARGAWFGGRATSVQLTGTSSTLTVDAEVFRSRLNLRSTWFIPVGSSVGTDFAGNAFSDVLARDRSGNLWNYPSNGRGGWLPRTLVTSGFPASPEVLAPGDFSGDGIPDLMYRTTAGALILHRGSGTGTIASTATIGSGWQGFDTVLAPGDLDGDGAIDILARDKKGVMWLYPTTGTGAWKPKVSKGSGWGGLRELEAVGDFDGDGGGDLVGADSTGRLLLMRFSPTGTYLGKTVIGSGWGSFSAFTGMGDVDGDGNVDLVARYSNGVLYAYRGNGRGGFLPRLTIGSGWNTLTIAS